MGKNFITHLKNTLLYAIKSYAAFRLIRRVTEMLMGAEDINNLYISLGIWCFYLIAKRRPLSISKNKQTNIKQTDKNSSFKK